MIVFWMCRVVVRLSILDAVAFVLCIFELSYLLFIGW